MEFKLLLLQKITNYLGSDYSAVYYFEHYVPRRKMYIIETIGIIIIIVFDVLNRPNLTCL